MLRLRPTARVLRYASAFSLPGPHRPLPAPRHSLSTAASPTSPSPRDRTSHAVALSRSAFAACSAAAVASRGLSSSAHADAGVEAVAKAAGGAVDGGKAAGDVTEAAPAAPFVAPDKVLAKHEMEIVLYQYDVCPFCNKVRAYLDYHSVPYNVVEVDPFGKGELKAFNKEYRKVPIAVVNGQQVNGSGDIIGAVGACLGQTLEKGDWLAWVDDVLIHLISPNIYRTTGESLQAFEYIADNAKFTTWQRMSIRYSGAAAMYFVGKKIKKKYNIGEPRAAIYEAVDTWMGGVREAGGLFLAGGKPGTADLAMFGVLRAIEKFDTYRDIRENCDGFEEWFERTRDAVGETSIVERL